MNNYQTIIGPTVEDLIKSNYKLVKKIAWHLHGRVQSIVDIEDLIQIGMMGLISAAQNYTPVKDASFTSYASLRIRGEIVDYLRKNSSLCRSTIKMKKIAENAIENLNKKYDLKEIIKGDSIFCATGITSGDLVKGINFKDNNFITQTLVTHKSSNTCKIVTREDTIKT